MHTARSVLTASSDLLQYIIERNLQPGDTLPSIQELASDAHLAASTGKVREDLAVLRAMGVVEVRSKTGTRLKEFAFTPAVRLALFFALARDPDSFEAFSALRTHVEVAFWDEACATLTAASLHTMRRCLEAARQKLSAHPIRIPAREHREFHLTVFEHLSNPFVTGLLEAYWDAYDAVEIHRYADYSYHQTVWDYHERILEALSAGDIAGAKQAFIAHTRLLHHHLHRSSEEEGSP
jgi:DNA-binding FadR family transcriptional regulator